MSEDVGSFTSVCGDGPVKTVSERHGIQLEVAHSSQLTISEIKAHRVDPSYSLQQKLAHVLSTIRTNEASCVDSRLVGVAYQMLSLDKSGFHRCFTLLKSLLPKHQTAAIDIAETWFNYCNRTLPNIHDNFIEIASEILTLASKEAAWLPLVSILMKDIDSDQLRLTGWSIVENTVKEGRDLTDEFIKFLSLLAVQVSAPQHISHHVSQTLKKIVQHASTTQIQHIAVFGCFIPYLSPMQIQELMTDVFKLILLKTLHISDRVKLLETLGKSLEPHSSIPIVKQHLVTILDSYLQPESWKSKDGSVSDYISIMGLMIHICKDFASTNQHEKALKIVEDAVKKDSDCLKSAIFNLPAFSTFIEFHSEWKSTCYQLVHLAEESDIDCVLAPLFNGLCHTIGYCKPVTSSDTCLFLAAIDKLLCHSSSCYFASPSKLVEILGLLPSSSTTCVDHHDEELLSDAVSSCFESFVDAISNSKCTVFWRHAVELLQQYSDVFKHLVRISGCSETLNDLQFRSLLPCLKAILIEESCPNTVWKPAAYLFVWCMHATRNGSKRLHYCHWACNDLALAPSTILQQRFVLILHHLPIFFSRQFFKSHFMQTLCTLCKRATPSLAESLFSVALIAQKQLQLPKDAPLARKLVSATMNFENLTISSRLRSCLNDFESKLQQACLRDSSCADVLDDSKQRDEEAIMKIAFTSPQPPPGKPKRRSSRSLEVVQAVSSLHAPIRSSRRSSDLFGSISDSSLQKKWQSLENVAELSEKSTFAKSISSPSSSFDRSSSEPSSKSPERSLGALLSPMPARNSSGHRRSTPKKAWHRNRSATVSHAEAPDLDSLKPISRQRRFSSQECLHQDISSLQLGSKSTPSSPRKEKDRRHSTIVSTHVSNVAPRRRSMLPSLNSPNTPTRSTSASKRRQSLASVSLPPSMMMRSRQNLNNP